MKTIVFMKRIGMVFMLTLICGVITAQSAKNVLDKAVAVINNKGGISADFQMTGKQYGNLSGSIAMKGPKIQVKSPQAIVWFNGKTMWTYIKKNQEVNVTTPTAKEIQAINPYNFINMYRKGYACSLKKNGNNYQVHLTTTNNKQSISEMIVTVNGKTYIISQLRIKQSKGWTDITIKNFKKANINDAVFTFNTKDYPQAEIIDLR